MDTDEPISQKSDILFIDAFVDFLTKSQYVCNYERTVYVTEVAAEMWMKDIKKKDFYEFYSSTNVYKNLKECRNYSWEVFQNKLLKDQTKIDRLLSLNGLCPESLSDETKIEKSIKLFARELSVASEDFVYFFAHYDDGKRQFLLSLMFAFMFEEKEPVSYFKKECRNISTRGEQIFKKVSKVYALAENFNLI
jgi:hypothetical protein